MTPSKAWKRVALATILCLTALPALAEEPQPTPVPMPPMPQPTVPQLFTLEGQYVRVAYNNEGFVTLGYRVANDNVGKEWMLLEVGATVRQGTGSQSLTRESFSVRTPDGQTLKLATQQEYANGRLHGLNTYANHVRDNIGYFPAGTSRVCALSFYTDPDRRTLAHDQVELNDQSRCLGRIYVHVPGGIKTGQHWLDVKFAGSTIQVPFRILTKEEAKAFSKSWEDIKEEHDASQKKK